MKNICIIFVILLVSFNISAQKLITSINTKNRVEPYSFKYNKADGCYIYADYDTASKKTVLITPKGTSGEYDYAIQYSSLFDNQGNVYTYAYNNIADTVYKYFLLKNAEEAASFDFISDGWAISNGIIYFYAKENNKAMLVSYDTRTGTLAKGKQYDEIYFVNYPEIYYEGEPVGSIGFTKEGLPYYMAMENNMKFLVTGNNEHKRYADIDWYMTKPDNNGELTYIAKSRGSFYNERGNTFVVQGSKEYKVSDYVYGPVIFDRSNNPVYVSSDSIGEYKYRSRIMTGNRDGESYEGNIYDFKFTPAGKIAYTVSLQLPSNKKDEYKYESFIVVDESEGKHYNSITNVTFLEGDVPVFIASNKGGKYFVVKGSNTISEKYDNIYDYSFIGDGSLAYIGNDFGNYEKQIPDKNFVHVSGKKYGPFDFVSMIDYTTGKYIITDKGRFAFVSGKLASKADYTYKYKVTTAEWQSDEYDVIDQVRFFKGKLFYVSGDMFDKINYLYNNNLYIDNKPAAENYSSITDLELDKYSGKISCIGCKANSFYLLEFE